MQETNSASHSSDHSTVDKQIWLVAYGDLLTVLVAFFVMLQLVSDINESKFSALIGKDVETDFSKGVSQSGPVTGKAESAQALQRDELKAVELLRDSSNPEMLHELLGELANSKEILVHMKSINNTKEIMRLNRQINRKIRKKGLQHAVSSNTDPDLTKVIIQMKSSILFDSGSAKISAPAYPLIDKVIDMVQPYRDFSLNVRGHTDNQPINTPQFPSNWELSAVRATSLLRYIIESGKIEPLRMTATGFSDLIPVDSNKNMVGRARNRRVEFILQKIAQ